MSGGTSEIHRDDEPLITGTHDGGNSSVLRDMDADFRGNGVRVGLAIEHVEKGYTGRVTAVTNTTVSVDWVSDVGGEPLTFGSEELFFGTEQLFFGEVAVWENGDTYKIYKTATKGSVISTNWVDLSRGWKTPKRKLKHGWREEDLDVDRHNPGRVFGPGQPERGHK